MISMHDGRGTTGHPLMRLSEFRNELGFSVRARPDLEADPAQVLRVGAASLAAFGIADTVQTNIARYDSTLFELDEPTIVSQSGIVILRTGEAVEDTLDHTIADQDGYHREAGRVVTGGDGSFRQEGGRLFVAAPRRRLTGRYLSLLLGNAHNHYHWLVLNLARVALLTESEIASLDGTLVPAGLPPAQRAWLAFTGLDRFVEIAPGEPVKIEKLLLPWNVASSYGASVRAMKYLRGWASNGGPASGRRIYVDRRGSRARPLLNEAEVIDMLRPYGFVPATLELMSAAEQISLFRDAEVIVGCHGAGLANIAFAAPGTQIVELIPSAGVNWCYRYMAAACGHRYDCVVGLSYVREGLPSMLTPWTASPTHVLSALDGFLLN